MVQLFLADKPISIHAPRTGSDVESTSAISVQNISIHAPRTGSDDRAFGKISGRSYFNPRSPHGERPDKRCNQLRKRNFNPRSPHGERRKAQRQKGVSQWISIHAPRTGSDSQHFTYDFDAGTFQSTLPARGATSWTCAGYLKNVISIHAPRTGSDKMSCCGKP